MGCVRQAALRAPPLITPRTDQCPCAAVQERSINAGKKNFLLASVWWNDLCRERASQGLNECTQQWRHNNSHEPAQCNGRCKVISRMADALRSAAVVPGSGNSRHLSKRDLMKPSPRAQASSGARKRVYRQGHNTCLLLLCRNAVHTQSAVLR